MEVLEKDAGFGEEDSFSNLMLLVIILFREVGRDQSSASPHKTFLLIGPVMQT